MPYVICKACGLTTYSFALYSRVDECPTCGTRLELPRVGANVISLSRHPRFVANVERAARERANADDQA